MTERLIRFSSTSTFMQSRSKYWLKYVLCLQKKYPNPERPALASDIGTIAHRGLEAIYKSHSDEFARALMRSKARQMKVYDSDKVSISDAYNAFDRHLGWLREGDQDRGYTTVAVEKRLYLDMGKILGDAVTLTGAPDLVQRDQFGSLVVRDWKLVASYDRLASLVNVNRQGLTYSAMVESVYGALPIRFELRQVHRKPPKTKTFIVTEVATQWVKPEVVARHMETLSKQIEDMVAFHQATEASDFSGLYTEPSQCASYGPCTDFDVCCGAVLKSRDEIEHILATQYEPKKETM